MSKKSGLCKVTGFDRDKNILKCNLERKHPGDHSDHGHVFPFDGNRP
jgi:hypothetical protein